MLEVIKIEPEMTYELRHSILRPHQPMEACMYESDYQKGSFHIGAVFDPPIGPHIVMVKKLFQLKRGE